MTDAVDIHKESTRIGRLEQALKQARAGSRMLDTGAGEQQFKRFCSRLYLRKELYQ